MARRKKDGHPEASGSLISRLGLQIALIAILGLVALSFITLGIIKRTAGPSGPQEPVQTKISRSVESLPVPPRTAPAQAAPSRRGPEAAEPNVTPLVQVEGRVVPKVDDAGPDPESSVRIAKTDDSPSSLPAGSPGEATGKPAGPEAAPEESPAMTASAAPTAKGSGSEAPDAGKAKPAFPPPPPERAEDQLTGQAGDAAGAGGKIPRPVWQTLDQQWDKVKLAETPSADNLESSGAAWKDMNVGEKDRIQQPSPLTTEATAPLLTSRSDQAKSAPKPVKPAPPRKKEPSRTSQQPRLAVINETGRPGQAEVYRDVLTAMGYRVSRLDDRPAQTGPTTILYATGLRRQALKLAEHIPGRRTLAPQTSKSDYDMIILIRQP